MNDAGYTFLKKKICLLKMLIHYGTSYNEL